MRFIGKVIEVSLGGNWRELNKGIYYNWILRYGW